MGATAQIPNLSLREKVSFLSQDVYAAFRESFAAALQKVRRKKISQKDIDATGVALAEDAVAHLALIAHEIKHKHRKLNQEALAKINVLQQMSEELLEGK